MNYLEWIYPISFLLFSIIIISFLMKMGKELKKIQKINQQLIDKFEENKELIKAYQHEKDNELQEEWRSYAFLQLLAVRNAVDKQTFDIYLSDMEQAPKSSGLTEKELSSAFTPAEIILINEYFGLFNSYIKKHWLTSDGKYKTIFRGNKDQVNSEVALLMLESKGLVKKLDKLLHQLKSY